MTIAYMSTYDPNTAEKHENIWKLLNKAHDREINSQYEIVVSSIGNICFDTRYHLRATTDLRITRNGPTEEIVYGNGTGEETALKIKANKNFVTTYSSYKVTTKGDEDYTSFMLQYTYMGVYHEQKIGLTLTTSFAKSVVTMGSSVLSNAGLKLSMSVMNTKLYLGALLGTPLIRISAQVKANKVALTQTELVYINNANSLWMGSNELLVTETASFLQEKYAQRMVL